MYRVGKFESQNGTVDVDLMKLEPQQRSDKTVFFFIWLLNISLLSLLLCYLSFVCPFSKRETLVQYLLSIRNTLNNIIFSVLHFW